MSKKKRKKFPQKEILGYVEPTDSEPQVHPDATLSPSASIENATSIDLLQKDSTSAPVIGEEEAKEDYVGSWPGLADKYLLSKKSVPFSIILIICALVSGFLFIQDNGAGLLKDFNAVTWTIMKSLIFFLLILAFWVALSVVTWIKSKM